MRDLTRSRVVADVAAEGVGIVVERSGRSRLDERRAGRATGDPLVDAQSMTRDAGAFPLPAGREREGAECWDEYVRKCAREASPRSARGPVEGRAPRIPRDYCSMRVSETFEEGHEIPYSSSKAAMLAVKSCSVMNGL